MQQEVQHPWRAAAARSEVESGAAAAAAGGEGAGAAQLGTRSSAVDLFRASITVSTPAVCWAQIDNLNR